MSVLLKIREVFDKFEEVSGSHPEFLTMHPATQNELIQEARQMCTEPIVLSDIRAYGCKIEISSLCPPDRVYATKHSIAETIDSPIQWDWNNA